MKFEEGRIIRENPLRILGVFSDTPKKEIVANLGKLRAFAKTGKILSFDSDFTTLLGPVNRTAGTIEKANNDITLPKDKLQAGMFWFMQHTDNDKAAMDCLKSGDTNGAMAIIQKKGNYSSVVNMAVLALILKRWDIALYSYAYLLDSTTRRGALVKAFTDSEDYYSEEDLVDYISDRLIRDFPSAHWIEQLQLENVELGDKTYPFKSRFVDSKLLTKIASECTITIKKEIDEVLSKANSVSKNDAKTNLLMAASIEEKCKILLKELKFALGKGNNTYIEYADNIANQILDNCIDYYTHDSDNSKRAKNVIKYTRFAYRIAEGKTTKERAKKNLDILNETLENLIPESIEDDYNTIDKMVMQYHDMNEKDDNTSLLIPVIDKAYNIILIIKDKVGNGNKHYISISSNFVYFAMQEVVKRINSVSSTTTYGEKSKIISNLEWGRQVFDLLVKFDKNEECKTDFDKNFHSLIEMARKAIVKQVSPKPNPTQQKIKINYSAAQAAAQAASSRAQRNNYSERYSTPPSNDSDNKTLLYFLILGGFVFLMIILFGRSGSSEKQSKSTVNEEVVSNKTTTSDNYLESSSTSYPTENKQHSNNSSSNYNDVINEDLSKYNFESDKSSQTETYTTVQYKTGDRPYQSTYGRGLYDNSTSNSLLIKNGGSTDAVVFLERTNGKKIRHVFIKRGSNYTMNNIPGGSYNLKIMEGVDWNPDKYNGEGNPKGGFMKMQAITKSASYDTFDYPFPSSGKYGTYEVTLYKVQNGNMHTQNIDENDLF